MPDLPDDSRLPPETPEEYALAPQEPPPRIELPPVPVPDLDGPPRDPDEYQFSLGELLVLVALAVVVLSVLSSVARWLDWGKSPASLAKLFGLVLGFGALVTMIALAFLPHARRIVVLGWWVLLGLYIVCAAVAAFMPK